MKILLDTHSLIWAVTNRRELLSETAAAIILDQTNTIHVSAASAWEIATKVRLGKLPEAEKLERNFFEVMDLAGYSLLPIDVASALRAGRFLADHGDPFDRMLAAQALADDLPILSLDKKLDVFGVRRIW